MASYDGEVVISTALDNSGISKGVKAIKGQLGGLKSVLAGVGTAIATAFSIRAIVRFGAEASKAARDLSDAMTGLQSVLESQGRNFSTAQAFIEEYTQDGLIPATNAVAAYKNLAMRGYDDSQIRKVMVALKDAAAYGRQASYTMGEAVQSASEGLKNENSILVDNAGVTKNVAKMWEEYAASIGTTAGNLTQAQKIQAEVNGILEESRFQTGDAAKVAGTLSGQLQQLSFNLNNLKVAVGNVINPFVKAFLPVINSAITAVTRFANTLASLASMLFGRSSSVSAGAGAVADSYDSAAESAEGYGAAATAAGKAAKKSLAGFDEIQKLNDSASGSGGGGSAAGGVTTSVGAIAVSGEVKDSVTPQVQAIVDRLKSIGAEFTTVFAPSIDAWKNAFKSLVPPVKDAAQRIGTAWTTLKKGSLIPFGEYIAKDFVPSIANTYSETFAPIFADIMPVAIDTWTVHFENGCRIVSEYCTHLENTFERVKTVFTDMCVSISEKWAMYGGGLLQGFVAFRDGLWETWWYIYDNIINPVITAAGDTFDWLWSKYLKPLWDNVVEFALSFADNILALWNGALKPFVDWVVSILAPWVTGVIGTILDSVSVAASVIADIVGSILTFLDGLIQFIVGVFTADWRRAWDGIYKIFDGIIYALVDVVRGVINSVILALNTMISSIYTAVSGVVNSLGGIVKTAGKLLGKSWGFSMPSKPPKIPYLAQGAVLPPNKPFMAMVGDQRHGTNIEAPLSTIQEAVALVMDDQLSTMMAGFEALLAENRQLRAVVESIEIGDEVLGKAANRYNTRMAIMHGDG